MKNSASSVLSDAVVWPATLTGPAASGKLAASSATITPPSQPPTCRFSMGSSIRFGLPLAQGKKYRYTARAGLKAPRKQASPEIGGVYQRFGKTITVNRCVPR